MRNIQEKNYVIFFLVFNIHKKLKNTGVHEIRTEVFQDVLSIIMSDVPLHRVITYKLIVELPSNN